jgi:hypothetical protein
MTRLALRDPVDGSTFHALECTAPHLRRLSEQRRITIRDIYLMARLALFGPRGLDEDWDPSTRSPN